METFNEETEKGQQHLLDSNSADLTGPDNTEPRAFYS